MTVGVRRLSGQRCIVAALLLMSLVGAPAGAGPERFFTPPHHSKRTAVRYDRSGRPEPPTTATHLRFALVGRWESEDYVLTIDQDAIQANRDPNKPFQWDALHILDATDNMIVFELGGDRYIALLTEAGMTLTQAGLPGHRNLVRKR